MPDDLTPGPGDAMRRTAEPASPFPAAAPLPEAPTAIDRHRPLLLALLVLVVGAALGACAFAAEQHFFVWKPGVHAVNDGWVVTGTDRRRPSSPTFAADRLVWAQGAYTCVLELDAGDHHVVGAASRGSSVWPAAAGARYVAWIEIPGGGDIPGSLWVYDVDRGRRQRFVVGHGAATPAVSGDVVAWYDVSAAGTPRIETLDMNSERRAVLAEDTDIEYPVLGGDGVVGWLTRTEGGPTVVLHELNSHVETTVPLAGSGTEIGDLQLAARTLLWTLASPAETRVVTFDLDTRATVVVARGLITEAATDGEEVVWTSGASPSSTCTVRGRSLDGGGEYEVGLPTAWPSSLAVGRDWVAWAFDDGGTTYLEALPVRR